MNGAEKAGYFKQVKVLSGYKLEVVMNTDTIIIFDFGPRLETARFRRLRDKEMFGSAGTDGDNLIFTRPGLMPVRLTAQEFLDLVLIDRSQRGPVAVEG